MSLLYVAPFHSPKALLTSTVWQNGRIKY